MPRLLFEKTGTAVWMSHLDLMRVFQRAFQRAGLPLTHTQGFNPRPSVSIALPLSVGVESVCELLDFDLEGEKPTGEEIRNRLNAALVPGVTVRECYDTGRKIRDLALLRCHLGLEYDGGIPTGTEEALLDMLTGPEILVEKKGKKGIQEQDIRPMILDTRITGISEQELTLEVLVTCQNPSLNPTLITAAIQKYLPEMSPNFVTYRRKEIYDTEKTIFR